MNAQSNVVRPAQLPTNPRPAAQYDLEFGPPWPLKADRRSVSTSSLHGGAKSSNSLFAPILGAWRPGSSNIYRTPDFARSDQALACHPAPRVGFVLGEPLDDLWMSLGAVAFTSIALPNFSVSLSSFSSIFGVASSPKSSAGSDTHPPHRGPRYPSCCLSATTVVGIHTVVPFLKNQPDWK